MQQRSNYENKNNYDYFISFHRNAFKPEAATGVETYTYLNQDSRSKAISKVILAQLGVTYKEESVSNSSDDKTLYRVMAGSFSIRENADKQVQKLKSAGFDATVMIFNK